MPDYSRADLLALTPSVYLADGYLGADGAPHRRLRSDYASAAATQFAAAGLPPQELEFTLEAIRQVLAGEHGRPRDRFVRAVRGGLEVVQKMIRQPNNPGLLAWLADCAAAIGADADIDAFFDHGLAVLRQYVLIAAALSEAPPG